MRKQLHVRLNNDDFDFKKVSNNFTETFRGREGGIWTSSFIEGRGSNWTMSGKFSKEYAHIYKGFLFDVSEEANIFYIQSDANEKHLLDYYKKDFNAVAKDFDGMHLDYTYIDEIKRKFGYSYFLEWSCECTWWFNPKKVLEMTRVIDGNELSRMM